jgi:hypothetical protein
MLTLEIFDGVGHEVVEDVEATLVRRLEPIRLFLAIHNNA